MRDDFSDYDGLELAALRRYIAGQSDGAEQRRVHAWAAEKASRRRYLAAMRRLYERSPAGEREETAAMWTRIAERMERPPARPADTPAYVAPWEQPVVHVDVRRRPPRVLAGGFVPPVRWPVLVGTAAALAAMVGGGTVLLRTRPHSASVAAVEMRQIATAKGQRAELRLSDGTRVVLGVDSRLQFPSAFGTGSRDLRLDGTAYFDVVHDAARPFVVHTTDAILEDIGTQFVVTAYAEQRATRVVVSGGAVALEGVRSPAGRVVLTKGQLGELTSPDGAPRVRAVDPARYSAWMRGELVLQDTPLSEVAAELGRWYDGEVRLGDSSLADVPLSASFTAESFSEAITVITAVAPVRAEWRGRSVTLYRR